MAISLPGQGTCIVIHCSKRIFCLPSAVLWRECERTPFHIVRIFVFQREAQDGRQPIETDTHPLGAGGDKIGNSEQIKGKLAEKCSEVARPPARARRRRFFAFDPSLPRRAQTSRGSSPLQPERASSPGRSLGARCGSGSVDSGVFWQRQASTCAAVSQDL